MAKVYWRWTSLLLVILSSLALLSFSAVAAEQQGYVRNLTQTMEVFEGVWDQETPPPEKHAAWSPINHDVFTSEPREPFVWIRGRLDPTEIAEQHWLLLSPLASNAQVFIDGSPISQSPLSALDSPQQKGIPFHHLVLELPRIETASDIFIRFEANFPISTPVKIVDQTILVQEAVLHTGLSVSLASIIFALTVYNLFLFFSIRNPIYLLYVVMAISVLLYALTLTNLLSSYLGMSEEQFNWMAKTLLILIPLLSIQFISRILQLKMLFQRVDRMYRFLSLIFLCILVATPFLTLKTVAFLAAAIGIVVYLSFVPFAIIQAKNKYRPALYFLIGWIPLIIAQNITALESLSILKGSPWVMYYIPGAMSWEMALFSLALASRIKILRDERDTLQAQQIEVSENARKVLERSNHIKDDFLNAVSHELRTPLHTIQGQLDLLRETPLNPEQSDAFHLIEYANLRMTRQVGSILDFVDAQEEKLLSSPQVFEPRSLFDLLEYEFREAAKAKPLSFVFAIDDSVPGKVFLDGLMLEKVLYQLIDNAMKFTPSGGEVLIRASRQADESVLRILVSDTGPGIPDSQREKVFQAFKQGEAGLTRRYGGVGLGLPLASSLVDALDGQMRVLETSGHGTTLEVEVPYGDVHLSEPNDSDLLNLGVAAQVPRILVVEDDPGNRMILRKQLEKMGVISEGVQNGLEAIQAAINEPWDMIIMDCQMPLMDGIAATREIRLKAASNLDTPIIAVTANASESFRIKCLEAGMDDYCTKPLRMDALKQLVSLYAEKRNTERLQEQRGVRDAVADS
ncbi:phospho-acceptor domain-containing protein [Marinobacter nauticus]|uniref:histidine kinase n=1 Tax=Marinobacter nauticus TaxID=2743 RepID=A0A368XIA0_MARNT|nr:7TM diverse intracellular signaling domain-containing protein [Marinobacter nauticus]RCW67730.1 phospho-acceptor domain-containing protein [Marinobacter nauticus]